MIQKNQIKKATRYELSVIAEALDIVHADKSDDELRKLIIERQEAEEVKESAPKKRGRPSKKADVNAKEKVSSDEEIKGSVEKKKKSSSKKSATTEQNKSKKKEPAKEKPAKGESKVKKVESEEKTDDVVYSVNEIDEVADSAKKRDDLIQEGLKEGVVFECTGVLDVLVDGYGFIRVRNYEPGEGDVYVSATQIKKLRLKRGDFLKGWAKKTYDNKPAGIVRIDEINGDLPEKIEGRPNFDDLTPIYPDERLKLEIPGVKNDLAVRSIDVIAPIGKGQRSMIVSPPKAGKTTLLKKVANSISENYPEIQLFVLLIDERPEEVTDMQRSIKGEVIYSTFDETPDHHTRVAELMLARAKRLVESGKDVVILMDSLTRLARAYNLTIPPTGRTLSGGIDPGALHSPKRFFGSARNIENGGSLTIIATALVDTGSRMDDVIYEEFKGTGNMEIHLDRKLSEKRIFPAIDLNRSSTRREELLLTPDELEGVWSMRKLLNSGDPTEATENLVKMMLKSETNDEFIKQLNVQMRLLQKEGYTILNRN